MQLKADVRSVLILVRSLRAAKKGQYIKNFADVDTKVLQELIHEAYNGSHSSG